MVSRERYDAIASLGHLSTMLNMASRTSGSPHHHSNSTNNTFVSSPTVTRLQSRAAALELAAAGTDREATTERRWLDADRTEEYERERILQNLHERSFALQQQQKLGGGKGDGSPGSPKASSPTLSRISSHNNMTKHLANHNASSSASPLRTGGGGGGGGVSFVTSGSFLKGNNNNTNTSTVLAPRPAPTQRSTAASAIESMLSLARTMAATKRYGDAVRIMRRALTFAENQHTLKKVGIKGSSKYSGGGGGNNSKTMSPTGVSGGGGSAYDADFFTHAQMMPNIDDPRYNHPALVPLLVELATYLEAQGNPFEARCVRDRVRFINENVLHIYPNDDTDVTTMRDYDTTTTTIQRGGDAVGASFISSSSRSPARAGSANANRTSMSPTQVGARRSGPRHDDDGGFSRLDSSSSPLLSPRGGAVTSSRHREAARLSQAALESVREHHNQQHQPYQKSGVSSPSGVVGAYGGYGDAAPGSVAYVRGRNVFRYNDAVSIGGLSSIDGGAGGTTTSTTSNGY